MSIFDDNTLSGRFDGLFGRSSDGLLNPHKFDIDGLGNLRANGAFTGTRVDKVGDILDEHGLFTGFGVRSTGLGRSAFGIERWDSPIRFER